MAMNPDDVARLLIGKTIKEVTHFSYLGWAMCIEEIIFTDGTIIEVGGDADYGRFDDITLPDGTQYSIDFDDESCK